MKLHMGWLALASALAFGGTASAHEIPPEAYHPGHGQVGKIAEVDPGVYVLVRGAGERSSLRMHRWITALDGVRAEVYQELGLPNSRHFELDAGRATEHWTYLEPASGAYSYHLSGATFIFSGNELIQVRRF